MRHFKYVTLAITIAGIFSGLVSCSKEEGTESNTPKGQGSAYITKVLEYRPAPGQFVNQLPQYNEGDTQDDMNRKVLESIGNNNKGTVSLGGYGGYVIVGFDHTIENRAGLRDFRILGNAFVNPGNGGSCEPGIVMVAYDKNNNGKPDADEWFEIAGSYHKYWFENDSTLQEDWFEKAKNAGNDTIFYKDFEMTYYKPTGLPSTQEEKDTYIRWEDNKGNSGYRTMNNTHKQSYYPLWIEDSEMKFNGSRLPQNGINNGKENSPYYVLYRFSYGYADNDTNTSIGSTFDIDWAIDSNGNKANLPGVDFIKVYTGVNQENGWLGECSTEIMGIEDLHILGENIETTQL